MMALGRKKPEGYHMIKALDLQNFRCYERLALRDLGRINVITGPNASGKTALLEALYFSLGTPALAIKMRGWRGLGFFQISDSVQSQNALWEDLFFEFDLDKTVAISIKGSDKFTRRVKIQHTPDGQIVMKAGQSVTNAQIVPPLMFEWYKESRRIHSARAKFEDGRLTLPGGPEPLPGAFYSSANPIDAQETGAWFSELIKSRQHKPIIEKVHSLFSFIEDLSVLELAGISVVHADIPSLPRQLPIGLVSHGVNKIVSILVAIAAQHHGILMIDEIEDGIYHNIMGDVWSVIYNSCQEHKTQLFTSSHSLEALRKLDPVMAGHEKDFRLIKTERKNGVTTARIFPGSDFSSALEQGMDVR